MSNQVMELRRSQMENMVTQANSILYDEIRNKNEIRETKADIAHTKMNFYLYTKKLKRNLKISKHTFNWSTSR